jgi:DNA polymerase-3 subunit gamma/tau
LLRAIPDAGQRGLVAAPGDVLERMSGQAAAIGPATLTRYAEVLHAGLGEMRGATAPRLLLEIVCARMLLPAVSDAESAVLQRVERLERQATRGGGKPPPSVPAPAAAANPPPNRGAAALAAARAETAPPQSVAVPPPAQAAEVAPPQSAPAPPPAHSVEAAPPPAEPAAVPAVPDPVDLPPVEQPAVPAAVAGHDPETVWRDVKAAVNERSKRVGPMLQNASLRGLAGGVVLFAHDFPPMTARLQEPHNAEFIQEAVREVLGESWEVRWDSAGSHSPTPVAPQARPPAGGRTGAQTYARKSRASGAPAPDTAAPAPMAEDVPPPEEPAYPGFPDDGAEPEHSPGGGDIAGSEVAGSGGSASGGTPGGGGRADQRHPDDVALELLERGLGAKPIR